MMHLAHRCGAYFDIQSLIHGSDGASGRAGAIGVETHVGVEQHRECAAGERQCRHFTTPKRVIHCGEASARLDVDPCYCIKGGNTGSIICVPLQAGIEKWDNLFDYRFGCLFWQ
jgi:hypothetical protein